MPVGRISAVQAGHRLRRGHPTDLPPLSIKSSCSRGGRHVLCGQGSSRLIRGRGIDRVAIRVAPFQCECRVQAARARLCKSRPSRPHRLAWPAWDGRGAPRQLACAGASHRQGAPGPTPLHGGTPTPRLSNLVSERLASTAHPTGPIGTWRPTGWRGHDPHSQTRSWQLE